MLLAGIMAVPGHTAETAAAAGPDPALVDAIVRKLESEGVLDRVVDRALTRGIERRQEAQRNELARQQAQTAERGKAARKVVANRDHIRGNAAAEVSLIEYSDFECPFCKRFHDAPAAVLERHGGRVNWVYRHFPLAFHDPAARREAVASECAAKLGGNEAFWKYTDALFRHTRSNGQGLAEGKSELAIATELGLKGDDFSRCLADPAMIKRVDEDIADGNAIGVTGTPATLVRNNRSGATEWVVGAQPLAALQAAVERVLDTKR
ncbi:MAG: DsbA family protein [Candidatus Didemnitutus sp.]|nr:DsbA family protein [Candidatus Didemnitutus sp.]